MSTFTFVINDNYKRCFVHQYQSEILTNDLLRELVHDTSYISSKMKPLLINETMECYHDKPVKLNRINNVWRDIFIIDNLIVQMWQKNITKDVMMISIIN